VAGLKGYLTSDLSRGFGYAGIVVAMVAGLQPLAVIPSAILIAGVFVGADTMSRAVGSLELRRRSHRRPRPPLRVVERAVHALPAALACSMMRGFSTSCSRQLLGGCDPDATPLMFGVLGATSASAPAC
jgi:hypothetical protein